MRFNLVKSAQHYREDLGKKGEIMLVNVNIYEKYMSIRFIVNS